MRTGENRMSSITTEARSLTRARVCGASSRVASLVSSRIADRNAPGRTLLPRDRKLPMLAEQIVQGIT